MFEYAVCEISGKQYKLIPNKPQEVEWLGDAKKIEAQLLLLAEGGKIKIGKPYLKEKITLDCQDSKGRKIRVAKYHAKANYRKVRGQKRNLTQVIWSVKN